MGFIWSRIRHIDWIIFFGALGLSSFGLITMYGFSGESRFFDKQSVWLAISVCVFFILSQFEYRFFRRTHVVVGIFLAVLVPLIIVLGLGTVVKGAQSWFNFGFAAFQPTDIAKITVILVLAKYLSKRHVEIANIRHIFISGVYAAIPTILILLQPDLGSALVIVGIWFCMVLVSGISKKHLALVFGIGGCVIAFAWLFVFAPFQKERIKNFINPLADIRGSGYNVHQSQIAIGSGELLGKGVGFGTQSRLEFLPEHETDFIFAAFAEEWGFVGTALTLMLCAILLMRLLQNALRGDTNVETFFILGVTFLFGIHMVVNIGMNIGLMPVTGIPLPFMSYGGSHLLAEWAVLGIVMGMRRYSRASHRDRLNYEFLGVE